MYHNEKRNKIVARLLSIAVFIVPILVILIWPLFGVTMTLCGVIVYQNWNTHFLNLAKKIHKILFKEEMR